MCRCTHNNKGITRKFSESSIHSQSTATTDTSSIAANEDSTVASHSKLKSEYEASTSQERTSILKLDKNGSSCRSRSQEADFPQKIQFHPSVRQRWHLALYEYTTEELDACWFQEHELAVIVRSCVKQIKILERGSLKNRGNDDHDRKYCARGLESHTRLAELARNQNSLAARSAVFEEQRDQLSLGVIDEEAIASRYRDASSSSVLWAIRVGQQDQRAAESVYDLMHD